MHNATYSAAVVMLIYADVFVWCVCVYVCRIKWWSRGLRDYTTAQFIVHVTLKNKLL